MTDFDGDGSDLERFPIIRGRTVSVTPMVARVVTEEMVIAALRAYYPEMGVPAEWALLRMRRALEAALSTPPAAASQSTSGPSDGH